MSKPEYRLYVMVGQEIINIAHPRDLGEARQIASEWLRDLQEQGVTEDPRVLVFPTGWKRPLEIWKPRRLQDELLAERLEVVR